MAQPYLKLPELTPQDIKRFWDKVDVRNPDECWPWNAGVDWDGYGVFRANYPKRSCYKAHRIAYMLHYGEDPWPLLVRHLVCDNPQCCNGAHLAKGTINDNNQDSTRKGRRATGLRNGMYTHPELVKRGEQLSWTKLTSANVLTIRSLYPTKKLAQLAQMFNVDITNISCIVNRKTWKHI